MKTEKTVEDGKMTNEGLGALCRRVDDLKRRINQGTLHHDYVMAGLQEIIERKRFAIKPLPYSDTVFISDASIIKKGYEVEHNEDSLLLEEYISLTKWNFFVSSSINGEELLSQLRDKYILLDIRFFVALWNDYKSHGERSVIERMFREGIITSDKICFFGTLFTGTRCYPVKDNIITVPSIYRDTLSHWTWTLSQGLQWTDEWTVMVAPKK